MMFNFGSGPDSKRWNLVEGEEKTVQKEENPKIAV